MIVQLGQKMGTRQFILHLLALRRRHLPPEELAEIETNPDPFDPDQPGDVLDVPPNRIHEVWNPGSTVAYSVHVYSPPLTDMEFFEL